MKVRWVLIVLVVLALLLGSAKYYVGYYAPIKQDSWDPSREAAATPKSLWVWEQEYHTAKLIESSGHIPTRTYGTLRATVDRTQFQFGYNSMSDSTMEHDKYYYRVFLPQDPSQADAWCAVAWPVSLQQQSEWPFFMIDQANKLHISIKPLGHAPNSAMSIREFSSHLPCRLSGGCCVKQGGEKALMSQCLTTSDAYAVSFNHFVFRSHATVHDERMLSPVSGEVQPVGPLDHVVLPPLTVTK